MIAVSWALGSMLCGALNDFAFKLFARRNGTIGFYIAVIGLVWSSIFLLVASDSSLNRLRTDSNGFWYYALVSGGFSVVANILLIESMRRQEVGVCSAVYRLNLVPAAMTGMLFLGESLHAIKWGGVVLAAGSVLAFLRADLRVEGLSGIRTDSEGNVAFMLLIFAALLRAGMGIGYKLGMDAGADMYAFLMVNGWVWVVGGVLYQMCYKQSGKVAITRTLAWGTLSGVLVCGVVLCLALALKVGEASIVLPITQLSFIATALLGVVLLGESLGRFKSLGLFLATCSILCMVLVTPL